MIHRSVALNITKNKGKKAEGKWISQTDLSHTLIGFAGSILIAPSSFGVPDDSKLEGYIHYWRVLGYLHGIEDRFNPFGGSMQIAQNTIADVTGNCLLPALEAPPADFEKMVQAVCSWAGAKNGIIYYGLMIVHDHHHKMTRKMDLERLSRLMGMYSLNSLREKQRYNSFRILFTYFYPYKIVRILLHAQMILFFNLSKFSMTVQNFFAGIFGYETPSNMI